MSFHFHDRFSDTMALVARIVAESDSNIKSRETVHILDIPAGAGRLTSKLREHGFSVTAADINRADDGFVFADMTKRLPFEDEYFDFVISMEGIEHIPNAVEFIGELSRVTKRNGTVILTTPNISCMYSRLVFLLTGFFFQFRPEQGFVNAQKELVYDYGHITPLTWSKILFHFADNGFDLVGLHGNKVKRKVLFPIYILVLAFGYIWQRYGFRRYEKCVRHLSQNTAYYSKVRENAQRFPALFSRNIVLVMKKQDNQPVHRTV